MQITVDASGVLKAFRKAPRAFEKELRIASKESLKVIQKEARQNHRFVTRSGNLERSVQTIGPEHNLRDGKVYLETGIAIYGPRLHKGWGSWSPDRFLFAAARKMKGQVIKLISAALGKAALKAGF